MKRFSIVLLVVCFGALTGCASVKMHETSTMGAPSNNKAIVNFVRPAVFFGDGLAIDIWDSEKYIGSLGSGRLIQYETEPGKHLFIGNAENWSYASGDLVAGKQYYIKANIFPGFLTGRTVLGVAKSNDERVTEWIRKLKPVVATDKDRKNIEMKKKEKIRKAVTDFLSGRVSSFAPIGPEHAR